MPYFYKLSESINNSGNYDNEWFKKVIYTIADFTTTCTTLHEENGGTIILIVDNPDEIKRHHKYEYHNINVDVKLDYEYVTNEDVPSYKIININDDDDELFTFTTKNVREDFTTNIRFQYDNLNDEAILELLEIIDKYYKYDNFNDLYMHITCKNYKESINEYGLLVNPGNKIGDYESQDTQESNNLILSQISNNDISSQCLKKLDNYSPESSISFSQFLTQNSSQTPKLSQYIDSIKLKSQNLSQLGTPLYDIPPFSQEINNTSSHNYEIGDIDDIPSPYPDYNLLIAPLSSKKRMFNDENDDENDEENDDEYNTLKKYRYDNIGGRKNKTHKRKNKTYRIKNKTHKGKNKIYRRKNKTHKRKNKI